jgi:zinc and cadmium transporter
MDTMASLAAILAATFLGSVAALLSGAWLLWRERWARQVSIYLLAFATGALLVAALLDLLPEALEAAESGPGLRGVLTATLAGIVLFFLIERFLVRLHRHVDIPAPEKADPSPRFRRRLAWMVLGGDAVHNFIDGVVVAGAFLADVQLGIVTAIAVYAHEVPQEVGDFGVLLYAGYSRGQVLGLNLLTALTAFLGAVGSYVVGTQAANHLWVLLAFGAGTLLYIANADLLPELWRQEHRRHTPGMTLAFVAGLAGMWLIIRLFG